MESSLRQSVLDRFARIKVWRRGNEQAPHKPMLVLYALGRWHQDGCTRVTFRDAERDLTTLLREFVVDRSNFHPEYPFWRLRNDGIWEVDVPRGLDEPARGRDFSAVELHEHNVKAGFPASIIDVFRRHPDIVMEIAHVLLDLHFPASQHAPILARIGLA